MRSFYVRDIQGKHRHTDHSIYRGLDIPNIRFDFIV